MINEASYIVNYINMTNIINQKLLNIQNKIKDYKFKDINDKCFKTYDTYIKIQKTINNIEDFIKTTKFRLAQIAGDEAWDDDTTIYKLAVIANKLNGIKAIILYDDRIGIFMSQFTGWRIFVSNEATIMQNETLTRLFDVSNDAYIAFVDYSKTGRYITYAKLHDVQPGYTLSFSIRILNPIYENMITLSGYTDDGYTYSKQKDYYKITLNSDEFCDNHISYLPVCNINGVNRVDISNLYNGEENNKIALKNFTVFWNAGFAEEETYFVRAEDFIKHATTEVYIQQYFLYVNSYLYNFSRFMTDFGNDDNSMVNMWIFPFLCGSDEPIHDYFMKDIIFSLTTYRDDPYKRLIIHHPVYFITFDENFSFFIDVYEMYMLYSSFLYLTFDTILTLTKYENLQDFYTTMKTFTGFRLYGCNINNFFKMTIKNLVLSNVVNVRDDSGDNTILNYITLSENNESVLIENIDFNEEKTFNKLGVETLINGNGSIAETLYINNCVFYKDYTNINNIFSNIGRADTIVISDSKFVGNLNIYEFVTNNLAINTYKFENTTFETTSSDYNVFGNIFKLTTNTITSIYNLNTNKLINIYGDNNKPTELDLINCHIQTLNINELIGDNTSIKTIKLIDTTYDNHNFDGFAFNPETKTLTRN